MDLLGCSYCISQASAEWRGPALLLALVSAAGGLVVAVAAGRAHGRIRLGLGLAALALVVVLPAAVLVARAGRMVVVLDPRYGTPDGEAWHVMCAGGFRPAADRAGSTRPDLDQAVDDACAEATAASRTGAVAGGALGILLVVSGTGVALTGRARTPAEVVAAPRAEAD